MGIVPQAPSHGSATCEQQCVCLFEICVELSAGLFLRLTNSVLLDAIQGMYEWRHGGVLPRTYVRIHRMHLRECLSSDVRLIDGRF